MHGLQDVAAAAAAAATLGSSAGYSLRTRWTWLLAYSLDEVAARTNLALVLRHARQKRKVRSALPDCSRIG